MKRSSQLSLAFPPTRGGRRKNAGRKLAPGRRPGVPHRPRPVHRRSEPVLVTLRARVGFLRAEAVYRSLEAALRRGSERVFAGGSFRVVHYSVQSDHIHALVEATDKPTLSAGMRGLAIRLARAANRATDRTGPIWGDRWHGRALGSPRELRNALVYVLQNGVKHRVVRRGAVDRCSSAAWFDGWTDRGRQARSGVDPPVAAPRTWLLRAGWRRRGLIRIDEAPLSAQSRSRGT